MNNKTLTKNGLAIKLFSKIGLSKRDAKDFVDQFFETIKGNLSNGEEVKLCRFGKFCLNDKKERMGRNPKTKKEFPVSERRVVTFQVCKKVKNKLEDFIT